MKKTLVIGGSSGIGKEIVEILSKDSLVISTSRNGLNGANENITYLKYNV